MSDSTDLVNTSTAGGLTGDHPPKTLPPVLVAPATGAEKNLYKDPLITVACWRMDDIRFEFDSSFISPDASEEFKLLAALRKKHAKAPISIFGHADPVGDDVYNKKLSGRRARTIYGLLTRDTGMWEELFSDHEGTNDKWGDQAVARMRSTLGITDTTPTNAGTRATLFQQYMEKICIDIDNKPFQVAKSEFLGKGASASGIGDMQGCSEFNPVLMFSQAENAKFAADKDKTARNSENAPNRRVLILFFKPGSHIDIGKWPCPAARDASIGKCKARFWSDSAKRRQFQALHREADQSHDTFACRFYDRLTSGSPCEGVKKIVTFKVVFQRFPGKGGTDADRGIGGVPYTLRVTGLPDKTDKTDPDGTVKVVMPADSAAILEILGSSYNLSPRDSIEALNTIQGVQRRLDMLGYHPGAIDGAVGTDTDDSVLKLQADNNKDTDGDQAQAVTQTGPYSQAIQDLLKNLVGE
jgi:outer membrane protein OmpA-like peptidoglycan-associated protein